MQCLVYIVVMSFLSVEARSAFIEWQTNRAAINRQTLDTVYPWALDTVKIQWRGRRTIVAARPVASYDYALPRLPLRCYRRQIQSRGDFDYCLSLSLPPFVRLRVSNCIRCSLLPLPFQRYFGGSFVVEAAAAAAASESASPRAPFHVRRP